MKMSFFTFFRSTVLVIFFLVGCTSHPMDGSTRGWDHMMGYGSYGGIFMWLIWIVIIGAIVYLMVNRSRTGGRSEGPATERPEDILKGRYARGEIDKEEYERLKRDIER